MKLGKVDLCLSHISVDIQWQKAFAIKTIILTMSLFRPCQKKFNWRLYPSIGQTPSTC